MKVRGTGCHLIGTEGSSPPLPYIEVEDGSAAVLIRMKLAEEVTDADAEPKKTPKKAEKAPETKVESPPPPPPPPPPVTEPEKAPETEPKGGESRSETILHALDLVEGEPTAETVAEITGLADVTAEEVAAAVAVKAAE